MVSARVIFVSKPRQSTMGDWARTAGATPLWYVLESKEQKKKISLRALEEKKSSQKGNMRQYRQDNELLILLVI